MSWGVWRTSLGTHTLLNITRAKHAVAQVLMGLQMSFVAKGTEINQVLGYHKNLPVTHVLR